MNLPSCAHCGKSVAHLCTSEEYASLQGIQTDDRHITSYAVVCDYQQGGCGASSGFAETKEEAIAKWLVRAN